MRMRNVKRWLASLLCVAAVCSAITMPAFAQDDIAQALDQAAALPGEDIEVENGWSLADLRNQFPQGRYWNHADNPGNNDPMHTSTIPCPWHDKKSGYNSNTCNHPTFNGYRCCWGYADQVGYLYSGSNPENWQKLEGANAYNYIDNLKIGDIIRFKFNSGAAHSVFVTSVTDSRVYYTDCNQDGTCEISWSHSQTKAYFRENNRVLWVQVCPGSNPPPTDPCATAYAGWYYVSADKTAIHSGHNLSSYERDAIKDQRVYVTKATGIGIGQLGHITMSDGKEHYIAMAGLTRLTGLESSTSLFDLGNYITIMGSAYNWDDLNEKVTVRIVADSGQEVTIAANQSGYNPLYHWSVLTPNEESQGDNHNFNTTLNGLSGGKHTFHVYVYSRKTGGWIETETQTLEVKGTDTTGPEISNVQVTNVTNTGYDVSCTVTDPSGVDRVQFPTWTAANGQDDLLSDWSTNAKARGSQNGNTWTFHVNIADHNNEGGTYCTDIHAYDTRGNESGWNAPRVYVDTEIPVISDVQVTNVTTEGYDVSCTVTDNVGVNRVVFPTWTALNDQDDLAPEWWDVNHTATRGTQNGDTWTFHVNIADHNNEHGTYLTHIYAYDDAGNRNVFTLEIEVPVPNPTLTFDANGGTAEFDTKQAERGAAYGALPEAWMDGYVFDGWYTDAVGGDRVSSATVYTAAGHTTLYAHWMPVASDAEQGWSLQDGTLIITSQGAMQDYTSARETPWFSDRADIRKIVVQNGVTSIGNYAFYGCENVTSVALPSTVTQIGKLAFYGCRNLSSLTLPDSLTMVEDYAFAKASGLGTIAFKGSAPLFGAGVFADVSAEVRYPAEDSTWTDAVRQSYTGNVSWAGVSEAELTVQTSDLQLNDPELEALLADSCV